MTHASLMKKIQRGLVVTKALLREVHTIKNLKGPSQPPPFSMPSKLLILHGEVKSEFVTIGCAPESMFNYF